MKEGKMADKLSWASTPVNTEITPLGVQSQPVANVPSALVQEPVNVAPIATLTA